MCQGSQTVVRTFHCGALRGQSPRKTPLLKQRHINLFFDLMMLLLFGEGREMPSTLKTQFPLLNMVKGTSCCLAVVPPQELGTSLRVHGVIKKHQYADILKNNLKKSAASLALGCCWVFQQDNDPWRSSTFFNGVKIRVLGWLTEPRSQSHWRVLKVNVHARKPRNLDELKQFTTAEWARIPRETCANLVKSYRARLLSVI